MPPSVANHLSVRMMFTTSIAISAVVFVDVLSAFLLAINGLKARTSFLDRWCHTGSRIFLPVALSI